MTNPPARRRPSRRDAFRVLGAALVPALAWPTGCARSEARAERRARRFLWVTRWDHRTADDVRALVGKAADAGFDALLFQVRGAASALYRSRIEPRAPELAGAPEDHDPLAVALAAAHARGLELHAWINVVPSWWGATPPADPLHVYHRHPEWHWYDADGRRQALSERFYVSLNPCLPGVRDYVAAVVEELVTGYELDGLHLDYIRFPNEPPATPKGADYPRDPATLVLFAEETGLRPDDDPSRWDAWRAQQVTRLVRRIRASVGQCAPDLTLSAAVGAEPERALSEHFQDVDAWIDEGLLDLVLPMNYTAVPALFAERLDRWEARALATPVAMGVMVSGDAALRAEQLRRAAARYPAVAVFAHHELFASANDVLTQQDPLAADERASRRALLLPEVVRGLPPADE